MNRTHIPDAVAVAIAFIASLPAQFIAVRFSAFAVLHLCGLLFVFAVIARAFVPLERHSVGRHLKYVIDQSSAVEKRRPEVCCEVRHGCAARWRNYECSIFELRFVRVNQHP